MREAISWESSSCCAAAEQTEGPQQWLSSSKPCLSTRTNSRPDELDIMKLNDTVRGPCRSEGMKLSQTREVGEKHECKVYFREMSCCWGVLNELAFQQGACLRTRVIGMHPRPHQAADQDENIREDILDRLYKQLLADEQRKCLDMYQPRRIRETSSCGLLKS